MPMKCMPSLTSSITTCSVIWYCGCDSIESYILCVHIESGVFHYIIGTFSPIFASVLRLKCDFAGREKRFRSSVVKFSSVMSQLKSSVGDHFLRVGFQNHKFHRKLVIEAQFWSNPNRFRRNSRIMTLSFH